VLVFLGASCEPSSFDKDTPNCESTLHGGELVNDENGGSDPATLKVPMESIFSTVKLFSFCNHQGDRAS
jgi:hypothetical protein